MLKHAAGHIARRAIEVWDETPDGPTYELPPWSLGFFFLDFILFLPIILYISYTLNSLYPVLAMVEDEAPPAYEPVSLHDELDPTGQNQPTSAPPLTKTDGRTPRPTSSSIRAMGRLLRSDNGFTGYFKGFACAFVISLAGAVLQSIFSSFLPGLFSMAGVLLAELALVQFSAAWIHIVITPRSGRYFWQRLPGFKKAFDATAKPTVALWAAQVLTLVVPMVMAWVLNVPLDKDGMQRMHEDGDVDVSLAWKGMLIFVVALILSLFLQVPLFVVLTRVQASLLPAEESTIISFDRSFQGRVDPAVITGKGYATMSDAWATFSRASWVRLIRLWVKVLALTIALVVFMGVIVGAECAIVAAFTTKKN